MHRASYVILYGPLVELLYALIRAVSIRQAAGLQPACTLYSTHADSEASTADACVVNPVASDTELRTRKSNAINISMVSPWIATSCVWCVTASRLIALSHSMSSSSTFILPVTCFRPLFSTVCTCPRCCSPPSHSITSSLSVFLLPFPSVIACYLLLAYFVRARSSSYATAQVHWGVSSRINLVRMWQFCRFGNQRLVLRNLPSILCYRRLLRGSTWCWRKIYIFCRNCVQGYVRIDHCLFRVTVWIRQ